MVSLDYASGTVLGWAQNGSGQLGDGTIDHRVTVDFRPPSLAGIALKGLYGNGKHTMAIMPDQTLRTWGWNRHNTLGDGNGGDRVNEVYSTTPVTVVTALGGPAFANVHRVSCGPYMSQALKTDGTLWMWGRNDCGQLGNNTETDSKVPVQVINADNTAFNDFVQGAVGHMHAVGLRANSEVWAWGRNVDYEIGQGEGTPIIFKTPVVVKRSDGGNLNGIKNVYSSNYANFALDSNSTLWAWGYNANGVLGNGGATYNPRAIPVKNSDGTSFGDVVDVAVGAYHVLAVKKDGSVWGWGDDRYGQVGNDNVASTTPQYYPVPVKQSDGVTNFTGAVAVYAGAYYSFILKHDGTMWSWGANWEGQLATNTTTARQLPGPASAFPQQ